MDKQSLFRRIPAVDRLLASVQPDHTPSPYPRSLVLKAVHQILKDLRDRIEEGSLEDPSSLEPDMVSSLVLRRVETLHTPSLRPVINATGIIVHTNLGRSILAEPVLERLRAVGGGYSNLEYDLDKGSRGSRYSHVERILREITSAEAAMVVNNNAAAVLLCLETLAKGREAVVSRGQLVEIGGSFRIPDVMKKSGAVMVEVGTTNRTHPGDYEEAITSETALLLRVHRSNFHIVGFTRDVETKDLVALGKRRGIPVMEDLGSGCLVDFSRYGLVKEPLVQDVLSSGVDLVTFSGDKLLGGPQAGIILGRGEMIERIRTNPLSRALRIDKLTLVALEETLRLYRDQETAAQSIPTLRMIFTPYRELRRKAFGLVRKIGKLETPRFSISLVDGASKTGGGAAPLLDLPSRLLALVPGRMSARKIEEALRTFDPPIIARVENEQVLLDVRTLLDEELSTVARAVRELALSGDES